MLKTVDVLIGLSVVMLIVSMAVTVVTHFVNSVANSRGRHLLKGLTSLLQQIDPTLYQQTAKEIVTKVLTHSLICQKGGRLGTVIHREELTQLLLELASGEGPQRLDDASARALTRVLQANGISDPGATLKNIRQLALQLEVSNPGLANHVRNSLAILQGAPSDFVAKINAWFDQTVDRISERFTASSRVTTFVAALLVAFVLQLDTVGLINRLSMDDSLRSSFVQQALQIEKNPATITQPSRAYYDNYYRLLASDGLIALPQGLKDWEAQWRLSKLAGILLSTLLLSLGAPFWYNALKNLLQLRSVIAGKDDDQRQARQSSQNGAAASVTPAPTTPSVPVGERGELTAVG